MLTRIAESANDEIKSISNALVTVSPIWARLRSNIAAGRTHADMDLTPALIEAVGRTADLRARRVPFEQYKNQVDAFDRLEPMVDSFMQMFYDPAGRRAAGTQRIVAGLRYYADEAAKISAEKGLDLGLAPVSPADIQKRALERAHGPKDKKPLSSLAAIALGRTMQRVGRRFQDPSLTKNGRRMETIAESALRQGRKEYPTIKVVDNAE